MSHLVEIAFKGNRKEFFLWDGDDPPRLHTAVIVEGDRGEDLGRVHATGELAYKRYTGVAHGALTYGPLPEPAPSDDGGSAPSQRKKSRRLPLKAISTRWAMPEV